MWFLVRTLLLVSTVFNVDHEKNEGNKGSDILGVNRVKRQFLVQNKPRGMWPNKTVVYYFDKPAFDFTLEKSVLLGMQKISAHTCIKFTNKNEEGSVQIVSTDPSNCYAAIGKVGGSDQILNFIRFCYSSGLAAHELVHVLGFVHAHQRLDRDEYLRIDKLASSGQYIKHEPQITLVPYDYGSIMQYAETTRKFYALDEKYSWTMGSEIIAYYDYLMINKQYECSCENELECKNHGYPNPANCSECNCPLGFGGVDCSKAPQGTVKLKATDKVQHFDLVLDAGYVEMENGEKLPQIDFIFKYLWITAPSNKTIIIELLETRGTTCKGGCSQGGIEVKTHEDPRMTSPRTCCDEKDIIKSRNNPTIVMAFNAIGVNSYKIAYKYR